MRRKSYTVNETSVTIFSIKLPYIMKLNYYLYILHNYVIPCPKNKNEFQQSVPICWEIQMHCRKAINTSHQKIFQMNVKNRNEFRVYFVSYFQSFYFWENRQCFRFELHVKYGLYSYLTNIKTKIKPNITMNYITGYNISLFKTSCSNSPLFVS
jgi:hypothetical protein